VVAAGGTAPTITTQPTNQTVTAPSAATFSVTASGSTPLYYQWLRGSTNIAGATNASYNTGATTTNDNGAQFRVKVTNAYGAVTSSVATLTVNPTPTAGAPTYSPNGGSYTGLVSVTLTSVTAGATIYYTTNGTAPTTNSLSVASGSSITLTGPYTNSVRAFAKASGYNNSVISTSAVFTVAGAAMAGAPSYGPNGGTYTNSITVVMSATPYSSTIYYTTNGTVPTTNSPSVANYGVVFLNAPYSNSVRAFTRASGYMDSAISTSAVFTVVGSAPAGLTGQWKFDEGSGSVANDSSGNSNTGYVYAATWTTGKVGSALSFGTATSYVQIASRASLNSTTTMTVMAWVRLNATADYQPLIGKAVAANDNYIWAMYARDYGDSSYKPNFYINWDNDGTWDSGEFVSGSSVLQTGVWYHVAGVYDGAALSFYQNGALVATSAAVHAIPTNGVAIRVGQSACFSGEYLNGRADDVRVYRRALTSNEIYSIYLGNY
jgi:hypothetical protein